MWALATLHSTAVLVASPVVRLCGESYLLPGLLTRRYALRPRRPSVGLHPRDMDRLISILHRLTSLGNTVVLVEHDEAIMREADHLAELVLTREVGAAKLLR